jgi:hypothetical protein
MRWTYSDKERKLLNYFDITDAMIDNVSVSAGNLYRIAIQNAFIYGYTEGRHTESLRRCGRALVNCKIYRLTPEWDAMIEIE